MGEGIGGEGLSLYLEIICKGGYVMARFHIEVPHEGVACARTAQIFLNAGSHFLTHADWGCKDGEHKAWIVAEVKHKNEARAILPPVFRSQAKITRLNSYGLDQIDELLSDHQR
jgi:hypothetical protein